MPSILALAFRRTLFLCFLLLSTTAPATAAEAAAVSPARQALETATNRILDCIKHPDYVNPATRAPMRSRIEDEVLHIFDFKEFSSRTVGPRWRSFNADQQKGFSDAFADLLISTYVNKIDGYNGEQVGYVDELVSPEGDRVEVRTLVTMKDGKKLPVAYRMLPKNGAWFVYDVLVENISLVKNYRTQFQDILNNAGPDQLIERVRVKASEVRRNAG